MVIATPLEKNVRSVVQDIMCACRGGKSYNIYIKSYINAASYIGAGNVNSAYWQHF